MGDSQSPGRAKGSLEKAEGFGFRRGFSGERVGDLGEMLSSAQFRYPLSHADPPGRIKSQPC